MILKCNSYVQHTNDRFAKAYMIFFFHTVSDESVNLPRSMRTPSEPATGNFLLVK